jgi:hypothetical protein
LWDRDGFRLSLIFSNGTIKTYLDRNDEKYDWGLRITVSNPLQGDKYFEDFHLVGTARDNNHVVSTEYSLNSGTWVGLPDPSVWNITIPTADLIEGRNTLVVKASNGTGERNVTISFTYQEPWDYRPFFQFVGVLIGCTVFVGVGLLRRKRKERFNE